MHRSMRMRESKEEKRGDEKGETINGRESMTNIPPPSKKPRQAWELKERKEKKLADRSVWIRGKGIGDRIRDIMPTLVSIGAVQRARMYTVGENDPPCGRHLLYVTFKNIQATELALLRLGSSNYNACPLKVWMAAEIGAYQTKPRRVIEWEQRKHREMQKMMVIRKERMIPVQSSGSTQATLSKEKLNKIRKLNEELKKKTEQVQEKKKETSAVDMEKKPKSKSPLVIKERKEERRTETLSATKDSPSSNQPSTSKAVAPKVPEKRSESRRDFLSERRSGREHIILLKSSRPAKAEEKPRTDQISAKRDRRGEDRRDLDRERIRRQEHRRDSKREDRRELSRRDTRRDRDRTPIRKGPRTPPPEVPSPKFEQIAPNDPIFRTNLPYPQTKQPEESRPFTPEDFEEGINFLNISTLKNYGHEI